MKINQKVHYTVKICAVADWKSYANRALRSFKNQCALNTYRIHHCKNDIVTYLQVQCICIFIFVGTKGRAHRGAKCSWRGRWRTRARSRTRQTRRGPARRPDPRSRAARAPRSVRCRAQLHAQEHWTLNAKQWALDQTVRTNSVLMRNTSPRASNQIDIYS